MPLKKQSDKLCILPLHVYTMSISVQFTRRLLFGHWHQLVLRHNCMVKESSERVVHNGSAVSRVLWSWADGLD